LDHQPQDPAQPRAAQPTQRRRAKRRIVAIAITGTDDEVGPSGRGGGDQQRQLARRVLAVTVDLDRAIEVFTVRQHEPSLDRTADAEVATQPQQANPALTRDVSGPIDGAVVDHHGVELDPSRGNQRADLREQSSQ
jgi:hypothetical protein